VIVIPSNTVFWFDPVHQDPSDSFVHDIEKVLTDPKITKHKEVNWKSLKVYIYILALIWVNNIVLQLSFGYIFAI